MHSLLETLLLRHLSKAHNDAGRKDLNYEHAASCVINSNAAEKWMCNFRYTISFFSART